MGFYFVCLGRHSGRTACTLKAQQAHLTEQAVQRLIQQISLTSQERQSVEEQLLAECKATVREADTGRAESLSTQLPPGPQQVLEAERHVRHRCARHCRSIL